VALFTLDGCRQRLGLREIALVKIDAEGAEAEIIEGGRGFFAEESPLVMFEIRHAAVLDLGLCQRFRRLGYQTFRLIPGLGLLAPFTDGEAIDAFLLNLFACKPDRAARLEQRGLLARAPEPREDAGTTAGAGLIHLRAQPFAAALWPRWADQVAAPGDEAAALDGYAGARDPTARPAVRWGALAAALATAADRAQTRPALPILQTWARIAADLGERAMAVEVLNWIVERCATATDRDLDRPFLPVSARFDQLPPREGGGEGQLVRWVTAAALEQRERLRAFSSYFTAADPATLTCLETIASLGYQSPEMARRLELVKLRRG
jgi:hypothetical protein